jgi:hypothetical protein
MALGKAKNRLFSMPIVSTLGNPTITKTRTVLNLRKTARTQKEIATMPNALLTIEV